MKSTIRPAESRIIAGGIAARLGIDLAWAMERTADGELLQTHSRVDARRRIISEMRKVLVCPRPMTAKEIAAGLGIGDRVVSDNLYYEKRLLRTKLAAAAEKPR